MKLSACCCLAVLTRHGYPPGSLWPAPTAIAKPAHAASKSKRCDRPTRQAVSRPRPPPALGNNAPGCHRTRIHPNCHPPPNYPTPIEWRVAPLHRATQRLSRRAPVSWPLQPCCSNSGVLAQLCLAQGLAGAVVFRPCSALSWFASLVAQVLLWFRLACSAFAQVSLSVLSFCSGFA